MTQRPKKLSSRIIAKIRLLWEKGYTNEEIAGATGVSINSVLIYTRKKPGSEEWERP